MPYGPATVAPLLLTAPATSIDAFDDATALGASNAGPVLALFAIPGIATNYGTLNLVAWGTKDAAGNIGSLEEMAVYGTGTDSAALFFDTAGHIVSILDRVSGYSVQFTYAGPSHVAASLCDPAMVPVATITAVAGSDGSPQGQAVAGGTCVHENSFALVAAGSAAPGAGTGAATNLKTLPNIASLISAGAYVAGMGFAVGALLKFKQHKDNPTQIPIGTPIALLFIAAALIFIPALFPPTPPVFGSESGLLGTAGVPALTTPP